MTALDRATITWLRTHHETVPAAVLAANGMSVDQRDRLVSSGVLIRLYNGAYAFAGSPAGEFARCAALCGCRPELVVAGPTAGRLWGIRRSPRDGLLHVIAPPASQPCRDRWVRPYRTPLLDQDDVIHRRKAFA